jgi:hypothetical protein
LTRGSTTSAIKPVAGQQQSLHRRNWQAIRARTVCQFSARAAGVSSGSVSLEVRFDEKLNFGT